MLARAKDDLHLAGLRTGERDPRPPMEGRPREAIGDVADPGIAGVADPGIAGVANRGIAGVAVGHLAVVSHALR